MIRGARVVRRRRLLRAAAIGSVAYQAGKRRDRNRGGRAAVPAPAPASIPASDLPSKLKILDELGALHEHGVLSDEEFARQKRRALEG